MSKSYSDQETIDYSNSKSSNILVENDFLVHLNKPKFFVPDTVEDHQVQLDNEDKFTDLQSCLGPINDDLGNN